MKVYLEEEWDFVPKTGGNDKLPKEEQCVITFKYLSGADFNKVWAIEDLEEKSLQDWLAMCKSVKNLYYKDIEVTPEGIFKIGVLQELWMECVAEYRAKSSLNKKK